MVLFSYFLDLLSCAKICRYFAQFFFLTDVILEFNVPLIFFLTLYLRERQITNQLCGKEKFTPPRKWKRLDFLRMSSTSFLVPLIWISAFIVYSFSQYVCLWLYVYGCLCACSIIILNAKLWVFENTRTRNMRSRYGDR